MQRLALLPCLLILHACTSYKDPSAAIVDLKGVDRNVYEQDLADCKSYAAEVPVGKRAAQGAAVGAAAGAAIGAVSGRTSTGVAQSAGMGAVYGGGATGIGARREQVDVLRECLRGRGYRILN